MYLLKCFNSGNCRKNKISPKDLHSYEKRIGGMCELV